MHQWDDIQPTSKDFVKRIGEIANPYDGLGSEDYETALIARTIIGCRIGRFARLNSRTFKGRIKMMLASRRLNSLLHAIGSQQRIRFGTLQKI